MNVYDMHKYIMCTSSIIISIPVYCIGGVMGNMMALSVVDCGFKCFRLWVRVL
jgi:hypothetical protein